MSEEKQNQIAKPIIFVNNPITSIEKDVIGFASQIQIICNAVENGATMIGIIADYGTGKSSMTEMLKNRFVEDKNPIPLKVNMWDSLSGDFDAGSDETVSTLTKSFLFQMANGHSHRFGSYVNRLLSKNYGNISFSTNHFVKLSICMFLSACLYVLYKIAGASGTGIMQFLPPNFRVLASCFKLFSPLFILGCK